MYENSRFLKNRFTFCGVNTNFGQQWDPPAYYHLTPIVSKGKHWNGCYIADNIFKLIFLYKNCLILILILLKFVTQDKVTSLTTSILYWPNYSHPCYPQVHRDEVLLKFQDEFQQKYTGDPYNVSFQFNR